MKVRDPQGQTWRVTRRWVPWRRRVRDVTDVSVDLPGDLGGLGDDPVSVVLGIVLVVLLLPFVVVALVAGLELLLILLVLPLAVLGRVLLGRRWTVEARRGWRPVHEELTGSWHDASVRIATLATDIERGDLPATTL